MVRIRAFQARGPGSIPGRRINYYYIIFFFLILILIKYICRACGVMVSTRDSESLDPGSNPGRPLN
jgi:hypothetical protein